MTRFSSSHFALSSFTSGFSSSLELSRNYPIFSNFIFLFLASSINQYFFIFFPLDSFLSSHFSAAFNFNFPSYFAVLVLFPCYSVIFHRSSLLSSISWSFSPFIPSILLHCLSLILFLRFFLFSCYPVIIHYV